MTWVHHTFFAACEKRIAEKQGLRSQGSVSHVVGSSLFDDVESSYAQR